jgi:hypothetical protein
VVHKIENDFLFARRPLFDLNLIVFRASLEAENEFSSSGNPLKHRFLELTQVEFSSCQKSENGDLPLGDLHNIRFVVIHLFVFFAFLAYKNYDLTEVEKSKIY